jgi:DNA-binding phage protein
MPPSVAHDASTVALFRSDPELAAEYLNQVLADGTIEELLLAMRHLSSAFGGATGVAEATKLNARTLYRTLSKHGKPGTRHLHCAPQGDGYAACRRAAQTDAPELSRDGRVVKTCRIFER